MLYAFAYGSALLSLLVTFALARHLESGVFQTVALGLTAGGFGAVLCNLGTDQSQLSRLLNEQTAAARAQLLLRSLTIRSAVWLLLSALVFGYAGTGHRETSQGAAAALFFGWAAMTGLQPNAVADFLHTQQRQQVINVIERLGALACILVLWSLRDDAGTATALWTGALLFGARLFFTIYQWRTSMREGVLDAPSELRIVTTKPGSAPRVSTTLDTTAAAVCNSFTAYVPVLFLDHVGHQSDLALYALVLQAANVVVLFQGVAGRLLSRHIAAARANATGGQSAALIFQGARSVLWTSSALAAAGGIATAAYLIDANRYGPLGKIFGLVAIVFAWGAWLGFGQVITRALVLHGQARIYALSAFVTSLLAVSVAWQAVGPYGAVASALSVAIPHSAMITFCAVRLRAILREGHQA